ncbi:hypothetical protein BGW36DRAFT_295323 [Talaromyces proteolyticus]|uniref:RRM domain-containing protein n=1 Tax=Talaromyces proteolyticus TaxID=1131652 RepID=A0AAD4PZW8_9EURO|nr:uncharacterized protein BGW36DRAFT_295323 [Talaromyces proteolyticus]KAH8697037.1 hypothetical protein BGW36DRAFT_295323 [Talaromyces proteolyticus]
MTPSPPDEALHFRGKTLTPESPRPLHIPEPSNIPVLENQMDPIFNDTSTYEKSAANPKDGLPYQFTQDGGIYEDANEYHSRSEGTTQKPGSYHPNYSTPSAIEYQQQTLNPTARTEPGAVHYPQSQPLANENPNSPNKALTQLVQSGGGINAAGNNVAAEAGVDFQSLLDNISTSASTALPDSMAAAASSPSNNPIIQQQKPINALSTSADLPPRPPPQDASALQFDYTSANDIHDYHQILAQNPNQAGAYAPHQQGGHLNSSAVAPGVPPGTTSGASGLPPPPVATFQHQSQQNQAVASEAVSQASHKGSRAERYGGRAGSGADDEAPWGPEVQKIYDEFLRDERVYVTEGLWDRFPPGSRLFVGNLPTERVTKRDLFHVFHKYGKLAQISIKQAYGFIQFLDSSSCYQALQAEQGGLVRGRNIHLEISKPQKNTRAGPSQSDSTRASVSRRSRSPEYSRGPNTNSRGARNQAGDRHDRGYDSKRVPFSDFRDEHNSRRRDDYRPPRSPSPRGFRTREGGFRSRDRTPERFDRRDRRRSRSPYGRDRRFRSPSPRGRPYDAEHDLSFSRRPPRELPDLQILAFDDVDKKFVYHVEGSFKTRGLRVDVSIEPPAYMDTAVQRQMNEGVPAVVKISRNQQYSSKVTLLTFDRTAGSSKPRLNEYPDLDLHLAVEMTVHAQSLRRAGGATNLYQPNIPFTVPAMMNQFPQALPQAQPVNPNVANPNQFANLISTLDGPSLQSLLGALQQAQSASHSTPQSIPIAPNAVNPVDLASLLNSATHQQNPLPTMTNPGTRQPQPPPSFGLPIPPQPANRADPNLLALLAKGLSSGNPSQNQAAVGSQVQSIVNQLSKWKQ